MAATGEIKVPGVSVSDEGAGRWKFRWRERNPDGSWRARALRSEGSRTDAAAMASEIARSVKQTGRYNPAVVAAAAAAPANLATALEAFIDARVAAGKFSEKTALTYRSYRLRLIENMAIVSGLGEDAKLPVTLLTRTLFEKLMAHDRGLNASAIMAYAPLNLLLNAWRWMADDPARWPHTPPPPASPRDYLPRTPKYTRTVAPSLTHVDACLRRLPTKTSEATRQLGIWLRYTGLRADTILSIKREDIDLNEKTLYVMVDKNRYTRLVPLSDHLIAETSGWLSTIPSGTIFPKRRHTTRDKAKAHKKPSETFKAAWELATEHDEVPRGVWNPPNRKYARPEHAIRAAFDAYLIAQGVSPATVDYLVGRNEGDVRAVHYGGAVLEEARKAVNLLPVIDWKAASGDNVVPMRRSIW